MRNDTIENRMDITDHVIREISTEALKEMISCVLRHAKFDLVFDTSDDDEDDEVERAVDAGAIQAIGSMIQEAAEIIDVEQVAFLVKRQGADIVEKDLSKMIGLEYRISWLLSNLIEEEISTRLVGTEFENVVDVMTVTSTGLFDFIENEIVQNENDEPAFDETDDSASEIDEDEEVTPLGDGVFLEEGLLNDHLVEVRGATVLIIRHHDEDELVVPRKLSLLKKIKSCEVDAWTEHVPGWEFRLIPRPSTSRS